MEFVFLTNEEKAAVFESLDSKEKNCLPCVENILQKIAGVYINKAGYHPEMADIYRNVSTTISHLNNFNQ